jgi:general secretion pathway protein G
MKRTSVFGNARIIKRATDEVNRRSGESSNVFFGFSLARTLIAFVVVASLSYTVSCGGRERQADRLYRKANQAVEDGNLDDAVEMFKKILDDYGDTAAAGRAEEAVELYRGLSEAAKIYPTRQATDAMISTARALESYRGRNGTYPGTLSALMPRYIDSVPVDAWGRNLVYRVKSSHRGYVLTSYGSDGAAGGSGDAYDIVIEDSKFARSGVAP